MRIREYSPLGHKEYFALTQFDSSRHRPICYQELIAREKESGRLHVFRISITRLLATRILSFIEKSDLSTRGSVSGIYNGDIKNLDFSMSVYTVRFSLHIIPGKRGGWFILECQGREPRIKDEFIEYGPKRKSGGRDHRYRRNLSSTEQNQVDFLKDRTPDLETILRWILRKYPDEVRNVDIRFGEFSGITFTFDD